MFSVTKCRGARVVVIQWRDHHCLFTNYSTSFSAARESLLSPHFSPFQFSPAVKFWSGRVSVVPDKLRRIFQRRANLRSCPPSLYLDAGKEGMIHLLLLDWGRSALADKIAIVRGKIQGQILSRQFLFRLLHPH